MSVGGHILLLFINVILSEAKDLLDHEILRSLALPHTAPPGNDID
jgi:hypothetical protein